MFARLRDQILRHTALCDRGGCVCDPRSRARALRDAQRERALRFGVRG